MGYRGKLAERQQARRLRRTGLPLAEIAALLGVSKSSVSLWVHDVPFDPLPALPVAAAAPPTPCSAASSPRSTACCVKVRPASGGCPSASSWSRGSPCTRGRVPSGTGR